ncbi:MAG TPA: PIN-like domain-containing protein [Allosphingosinicella sp.]
MLERFGIKPVASLSSLELERLLALMERKAALPALEGLLTALKPSKAGRTLEGTAVAFDSSVFLRLSSHRRRDDIVDYLESRHKWPIILPGQAIQEFWNNQFQAVESTAAAIKGKFSQIREEIAKIDPTFSDFRSRFDDLVEEFESSYGYVYDEGTTRRTVSLVELLLRRAIVPYAPRDMFAAAAIQRKRSKTPPGFKDEGDGDFFVWVDLLAGLLGARRDEIPFSKVALITNDRKIDWSRAGVPHPLLIAEMKTAVSADFEVWTLDQLAQAIQESA